MRGGWGVHKGGKGARVSMRAWEWSGRRLWESSGSGTSPLPLACISAPRPSRHTHGSGGVPLGAHRTLAYLSLILRDGGGAACLSIKLFTAFMSLFYVLASVTTWRPRNVVFSAALFSTPPWAPREGRAGATLQGVRSGRGHCKSCSGCYAHPGRGCNRDERQEFPNQRPA